MSSDAALPVFIAESVDLLREFEDGLLKCSDGGADAEVINLIFRSAHTIKGSAGLFGLNDIVEFMHVVETLLDSVRQGVLPLTPELITLLLRSKDHIDVLITRVIAGQEGPDPVVAARGEELTAALRAIAGAAAAPPPADAGAIASEVEGDAPLAPWGISVRFGPQVLQAGMDPLGFIRYLQTFGTLTAVKVLDDTLPAARDLQPELCYLGFELELLTHADAARIEAAFEFVREDCTLTLRPPATGADRQQMAADQPAMTADRQEMAADQPATIAGQPATAAVTPSAPRSPPSPAGRGIEQMVRVDAAKLDFLITRIGELITAVAGASMLARRSASSELQDATVTLTEMVEQVRDGALQLRMVKIGATFNRFQRLVRDASQELGKEIRLLIEGEETELDKTVVERISDPLTHLVRNAMDHGIEPLEARLAAGKPAAGTVTLSARHDSGSIVLDISDDGGGLNRERILAKAVERGLAEPGATLSDREIFNFIFEPGFSTAPTVTNLSGRGVGMDVVKRNISDLRGSISIHSSQGVGTRISVRLPLTLAIIQGFQVGVGRSVYVLPLDSIEECIEYSTLAHHPLPAWGGHRWP